MSESSHLEVAAYALGVLDDGDVEAFERHLDSCKRCQQELKTMAELPGLLDEAKFSSERTN
ncbi:zf-HC2 domain-containing protein [Herbidospora mongoliensis]|uniref:zf-HC2 domain-containing protein n=1 Tax=Herbidospora mongoliensis TaxID=688067 RepID=UPI00082F6A67|nr:zf-HC2 domain-containing protein [Herbidospora mongoliensis]